MASPTTDGALLRREDPPLVTGAALYCDDLVPPGALHAVFVRAPLAHGRILAIDPAPAAAMPGVAGVFTAADLDLPPLPAGGAPAAMARPVLATGTVRFLGEAVAVVVAATRAQAVDAAEAVEVDYEPLEVVTDPRRGPGRRRPPAVRARAATWPRSAAGRSRRGPSRGPRWWSGAGSSTSGWPRPRSSPTPPWPSPSPSATASRCTPPARRRSGRGTRSRRSLGMDPERVRVVVPAVGGAFGARIHTYPEQVAVAALAWRLGRPVRYVESRSETMLAMTHGRAQVQEVELAATRDGRITGLRARLLADGGAYPADATPMLSSTRYMASGVYRIAKVEVAWECVATNTTPVAAYRGAGRPEATAMVERAVDLLAARLGIDPAELRRRNLIPARAFPYTTATKARYDSGDYQGALDRVLEAAGYEELRGEQAARRQRGDVRQLGIGLSVYVEVTGFGSEFGEVVVEPDGRVTARTGVSPHGQGHETAFAQLVAATLGVGADQVGVVHSDTFAVPRGEGTMGSRSLQVGGSAVAGAATQVLEKARALAAHLLEAPAEDVAVFPGEGLGVAGAPSTALAWAELAAAAADPDRRPPGMDAGLAAAVDFELEHSTFPFGAHLAVCEVDTETGLVRLLRHVAVDDSGRIHNRMLAEGQVHGGIAQGVAQALFEEVGYDEDGNCLHGNLASYAMPAAADLPAFETQRTADPDPAEPVGGQGDRRVGHRRGHPGGPERGRRRPRPPGRDPHRHAADPRAGLAGAAGRALAALAADLGRRRAAGGQLVLHGEGGRLQLGVHLQLLEDVLHVGADGVGADVELAADLGVAPAAAEQGQHLPLPRGQPVQGGVGGPVAHVQEPAEQLGQHRPRHHALAVQHRLDGPQHRLGAGLLADHAHRAGPDGVQQQVDVGVLGEQDDLGVGQLGEDRLDQRRPAAQGQAGVDHEQVGLELGHRGHDLGHGRCLPDHLVGAVTGDESFQRLVEQRLTVGEEYASHQLPPETGERPAKTTSVVVATSLAHRPIGQVRVLQCRILR